MATIYAAADGTIVRFLATRHLEEQYPDPPVDAAFPPLVFDIEANRTIVRAMNESTDTWGYDGTTLTNNSVAVPIAPASPDSRKEIILRLQALQSEIQAATTVNQLKATVQDMRRIVLALVRAIDFPEE